MALLQNVIGRGLLSARPTAGSAGVLYFCSDTGQLYRDSGAVWQLVDVTSLFATKGDLLVGTGSGTVAKLGAGTDTYVLTADSAQTDGIKWAAVAASGALTQISDQTLGSDTATVTFSSIPGTYNHLKLIAQARGTNASIEATVNIKINSDAGSNYDTQYVATSSTTTTGGQQVGVATAELARISGASSTTGNASSFETLIPNYAGTTFHKVWQTLNFEVQDQVSTDLLVRSYGGHWRSTSAITQIDLSLSSGTFKTGSRFTLYGLT